MIKKPPNIAGQGRFVRPQPPRPRRGADRPGQSGPSADPGDLEVEPSATGEAGRVDGRDLELSTHAQEKAAEAWNENDSPETEEHEALARAQAEFQENAEAAERGPGAAGQSAHSQMQKRAAEQQFAKSDFQARDASGHEHGPALNASNAAADAAALSSLNPQDPHQAYPLRYLKGAMVADQPGTFFREGVDTGARDGDQPSGAATPEALLKAVEKARQLLDGVRGIDRVAPGRDGSSAFAVLVFVAQGFTEKGLATIPQEVDGFPVIVPMPYQILPLRRER